MIIECSGLFTVVAGIASDEEALLAVGMGARAISMEFGPTPRQVSMNTAHDIVRRLPAGVAVIGSFSSEMPQRIVEVVNTLGLTAAEVAGPVGLGTIHYVAERIRTVIRTLGAPTDIFSYLADPAIDHFRLPATEGDAALAQALPIINDVGESTGLIVAGADEFNVADLVRQHRVWGVEAGSSLRRDDGRVDLSRLSEFLRRANEAYATSEIARFGREDYEAW